MRLPRPVVGAGRDLSEERPRPRPLERLLWAGLGLTLAAVIAAGAWSWLTRPAPLPVLGSLPDFALVDQDGRAVAASDLRGKVWVADFIFTRCTGVCPILTASLVKLHQDAPAAGRPLIVSISVDPVHDTPEVLRAYAARQGVRGPGWLFLTGPRDAVHRLVRDGFKLAVAEAPPGAQVAPGELVTHSDRFMLVDRKLRIRATYHGTEPDAGERVRADAAALGRE